MILLITGMKFVITGTALLPPLLVPELYNAPVSLATVMVYGMDMRLLQQQLVPLLTMTLLMGATLLCLIQEPQQTPVTFILIIKMQQTLTQLEHFPVGLSCCEGGGEEAGIEKFNQ